jgi:Haem-binding domain/Cytochrome P460
MKNILKRRWFWMMVGFLIVFIGLQFVQKPLENLPVTAYIQAPDSIQRILIRSCYNCHSNITQLSWYDKIAPASWLVQDHVREGRKMVNFSEWDSLAADQQKGALFESLNQMQFQIMPLKQYTFVHPSAKLNPDEINVFRRYVGSLVTPLLPDTTKMRLWKEQYALWISGNPRVKETKLSPNGIMYNPDYKNWVAISSTERFDNGTIRVIVGNDVAVNAAKEGHVNPWPDGTMIVKILWISVIDFAGTIHPGALRQLDFMIKDEKKFAETAGWGFTRWVGGLELKPYGKNALFASECVRCHQSMQKNDFVFTEPINLKTEFYQEGKVITSFIDQKQGTMSTLYGNNKAAEYARTHSNDQYSAGSELTLVTWNQKPDEHWFGAMIPGEKKIIETIQIIDSAKGNQTSVYEIYGGSSMEKMNDQSPEDVKIRKNFILKQRASVMP